MAYGYAYVPVEEVPERVGEVLELHPEPMDVFVTPASEEASVPYRIDWRTVDEEQRPLPLARGHHPDVE